MRHTHPKFRKMVIRLSPSDSLLLHRYFFFWLVTCCHRRPTTRAQSPATLYPEHTQPGTVVLSLRMQCGLIRTRLDNESGIRRCVIMVYDECGLQGGERHRIKVREMMVWRMRNLWKENPSLPWSLPDELVTTWRSHWVFACGRNRCGSELHQES